ICLVFLITYKGNGFPAIFFTSSTLYHTICRMNLKMPFPGLRSLRLCEKKIRIEMYVLLKSDEVGKK
ncbi:hypothetical protein, partial [uncultured Prevotella sp.]|uniref:hypothetical protein n=1 Tax=uncultured Prevotella sp. TaxID=159272 RepID=UPI00258E3275